MCSTVGDGAWVDWMKVLERQVNMAFPSAEFRGRAFRGEELGLDARDENGPWAEHGEGIRGGKGVERVGRGAQEELRFRRRSGGRWGKVQVVRRGNIRLGR